MEIEFVPLYMPVSTDNTAAIDTGSIVATSIEGTPNGSAFGGTSLATMVENASFQIHNSWSVVKRYRKMSGTEEAAWGDTSNAAVSQFTIGIILDTRVTHVPVIGAAGTVFVKRLMQWRNRIS